MKKPEHLVKYKWIEDALRERIRKADADDTLPSERLLAEEFRTTPVTVRRALAELADDGLILRRPRRATRIVRRDAAIRVYGGNSEAVRQVFAQTLPRQFPGERFEFLEPVPLGLEAVFGRCDIMLAPTTVLHEYERYFAPLPPDVLHRILEKPGIGPRMLDIHRRAGRCYGIPILASAGGMQVNLALLREIGYGECPSSLDLPALLEIRRSLARRPDGPALMDRTFYNVLITHLILMFGPVDSEADADWSGAVEKGLEAFCGLYAGGAGDFASGKALFRIACRQSAVYYEAREHLPFPVRVIPLPAGSPWSGIPFSGAVLVSGDHPRPKRLFEIGESLLSSAVQEAIGRSRNGFPVLSAARYSSPQPPVQGDDVFACGLERCCYRQPPLLLQLRPVLWSVLGEMLDGIMNMEDARAAILETSRGLQSHGRAKRRFVAQFGARGSRLGQEVA